MLKKLEKIVLVLFLSFIFIAAGTFVVASSVEVREKQLLADGNMEAAATASWTVGNGATLSKQTTTPYGGAQVLRVAYNGTANAYAYQTASTSASNSHRLRGWARGDGGNGVPRLQREATILWTGTNSTSWQYFDITTSVSGVTIQVVLRNLSSAAGYVEFDDVYVTAYAPPTKIVAAYQPMKNEEKQLFVDGNMEASGVASWTATGTATRTKSTSSPHGGAQSLSTTATTSGNGVIQNILAVGSTYRVRGWIRGDGANAVPKLYRDNGGGLIVTGTSSASWQYVDATFTPTTNGIILLYTYSTGYPGTVGFDDLVVTKIN